MKMYFSPHEARRWRNKFELMAQLVEYFPKPTVLHNLRHSKKYMEKYFNNVEGTIPEGASEPDGPFDAKEVSATLKKLADDVDRLSPQDVIELLSDLIESLEEVK